MPYITLLTLEHNPPNQDRPELDAEIPADFDFVMFPIIARHWYGVNPAAVCVETVAQAV